MTEEIKNTDEFTQEQMATLEYKFYDKNLTLLAEINKKLDSIKTWVTFFGIVWVIGQLIGLLVSCGAL